MYLHLELEKLIVMFASTGDNVLDVIDDSVKTRHCLYFAGISLGYFEIFYCLHSLFNNSHKFLTCITCVFILSRNSQRYFWSR